jgi:PleD family two-component response regulator
VAVDSPLQRPGRTRVLVAVSDETRPRMEKVLAGHDLVIARNSMEAEKALATHDFGLIVLGVNFDESRMFELLAYVRAQERHHVVPVLCVLGSSRRLTAMAVEAIDRAAKAMLANAFLWLEKFPDDEAGDARIRRIADYLILIDGDMHQGVSSS